MIERRMDTQERAAELEQRAEALAAAARRLRAPPRQVPLVLRVWALARGVLDAADEDSTTWGLIVGALVTIGPELARWLIAIEPFAGLYLLGLLGLALLLVRDLPRGLVSGWQDLRLLARGSIMLDDGEPLRRLKRRRRASGRTPGLALGLGPRRIDLRLLDEVAAIDPQGQLRARPRVLVAPLLAMAMVGFAALFFAVALIRIAGALVQWL